MSLAKRLAERSKQFASTVQIKRRLNGNLLIRVLDEEDTMKTFSDTLAELRKDVIAKAITNSVKWHLSELQPKYIGNLVTIADKNLFKAAVGFMEENTALQGKQLLKSSKLENLYRALKATTDKVYTKQFPFLKGVTESLGLPAEQNLRHKTREMEMGTAKKINDSSAYKKKYKDAWQGQKMEDSNTVTSPDQRRNVPRSSHYMYGFVGTHISKVAEEFNEDASKIPPGTIFYNRDVPVKEPWSETLYKKGFGSVTMTVVDPKNKIVHGIQNTTKKGDDGKLKLVGKEFALPFKSFFQLLKTGKMK